MYDPIAIAILAGGQSRRMGQDKALLKIDNITLLDRTIDTARQVSDTVAVIGRQGAREDVGWLEDDAPSLGPIGGLKTALTHLNQPLILLACDMPQIDVDALKWLYEQALRSVAAHGFATEHGAQVEPLFSLYRPAVLPAVAAQIAAQRLSLRRLIEGHLFEHRKAPAQVAKKLLNINTPQDLAALAASAPQT